MGTLLHRFAARRRRRRTGARDQVRQLRDCRARQLRLEKSLGRRLSTPARTQPPRLIPGIGAVTAGVLTAGVLTAILDIERLDSPTKRVAYFGVMPIEVGSGVEREGTAQASKRYVMCRRGNDLVRRYLWTATLSAVQFNPAVGVLYASVVANHPQRKAIAIGHTMRKLLHLAFRRPENTQTLR